MAIDRLVRVQCDRCLAAITVDESARRDGWGTIAASPAGEGRSLSGLDLCPDCYSALFAWRVDGSGPPPPAPPLPTKPEISRSVRLAAYEQAETALVDAITVAIAVLKHEPTRILDDAITPGALVDAEPIATKLVDQLIRDFGLLRRGR